MLSFSHLWYFGLNLRFGFRFVFFSFVITSPPPPLFFFALSLMIKVIHLSLVLVYLIGFESKNYVMERWSVNVMLMTTMGMKISRSCCWSCCNFGLVLELYFLIFWVSSSNFLFRVFIFFFSECPVSLVVEN